MSEKVTYHSFIFGDSKLTITEHPYYPVLNAPANISIELHDIKWIKGELFSSELDILAIKSASDDTTVRIFGPRGWLSEIKGLMWDTMHSSSEKETEE